MLAPLHQEMGAKAIAEQSLGTKLCEIVFSQTRYIKNCTLYFGLKKKKDTQWIMLTILGSNWNLFLR